MSKFSRRRLLTGGVALVAGGSGLTVATGLARRYGLIPPDGGGMYGAGETLTYASQRLLTRHSLAREFARSQISKAPFANGKPPEDEVYNRHRARAFADWRGGGGGMGGPPPPFSLARPRGVSP